MNKEDTLAELAKYIMVLHNSFENCHQAEDRKTYKNHLAEAAIMLAEYYLTGNLDALKKRIAGERHSYGWGYLSLKEGEAAESAFHKIDKYIEGL